MKRNDSDAIFSIVYILISLTIFAAHIIKDFPDNIVLHVIVSAQTMLLTVLFLQFEKENYWLIYFIFLFILNHFSLPQIHKKFYVPKIDLSIISLIFLNIFLVNSFD